MCVVHLAWLFACRLLTGVYVVVAPWHWLLWTGRAAVHDPPAPGWAVGKLYHGEPTVAVQG
jgi:hypothetical protein